MREVKTKPETSNIENENNRKFNNIKKCFCEDFF